MIHIFIVHAYHGHPGCFEQLAKRYLRKQQHYHKVTGTNKYCSIIININAINYPTKRHRPTNHPIRKWNLSFCCLQETHLVINNGHYLRVQGWQKLFQANGTKRQAGIAVLISDKIDIKLKLV